MYRYMCYVSENGDKKVFYDTVAEIKKLYPDCTEDTSEIFDRTEMGQVLLIPDGQGNTHKICIKKEYKTNQVFVMSETYLSKYYEDKQVSDNFSYRIDRMGRAARIGLSIAFLVVNIIASHVSFWVFEWQPAQNFVILVVLTVIYVISSLHIKKKWDTGTFKTLFIQLGGIPFCIILLLSIVFFFIGRIRNDWVVLLLIKLLLIIYGISFLRIVLPALAVSGIITSIIYKFSKSK